MKEESKTMINILMHGNGDRARYAGSVMKTHQFKVTVSHQNKAFWQMETHHHQILLAKEQYVRNDFKGHCIRGRQKKDCKTISSKNQEGRVACTPAMRTLQGEHQQKLPRNSVRWGLDPRQLSPTLVKHRLQSLVGADSAALNAVWAEAESTCKMSRMA